MAGRFHLKDLPRLALNGEGWGALCAALARKESGSIDGAWGSSAALGVAALAASANHPLLVVLPTAADVVPWTEDLAGLTGVRPEVFPAFDTWPIPAARGRLSVELAGRLKLLQKLTPTPPPITLATFAALTQPVPPPAEFVASGRNLKSGTNVDPDELATWLANNGYKRAEAVEYIGEYARRGGILDVYPPNTNDPIRLEYFGDDLESIRVFSVATQRSGDAQTQVVLLPVGQTKTTGPTDRAFLTDHFPTNTVVVLVEPGDLKEQGRHFFDRIGDPTGLFSVAGVFQQLLKWPTVTVSAMPRPTMEASVHFRVESVERFSGNIQRVQAELEAVAGAGQVLIACATESEVSRLTEVLKDSQVKLSLVTGYVRAGFRLVDTNMVVMGSHELFHKEAVLAGVKGSVSPTGRKVESRAIDSFLSLNEGDYVVHVAHGIGRFRGMKMLEKGTAGITPGGIDDGNRGGLEEHLLLEFHSERFLYVPASRIDLVQRYVGGQHTQPELSRLGGTSWGRRKEKASEAVRDMAAEMIQIQAMRAALPGSPLPPDSDWQKEFEGAFPYQETPDQLTSITDIKGDLERNRPMDRLLCGDVGYGKTECAIRGAFKAIDNGKQVAVLVPTTVLAEQHYRTFSQRLAEYPFVVEVLSRFKSPKQQKDILKRTVAGEVDILIGTHRVVSNDVKFKDLGLVIIDEEQRFGVEHKERLKKLRASVPILTMTATPIPRTLHGALLGVREISNLETPPLDRYPVETRIVRWDDTMIRHAIYREMNRGGQIYFVHNRVFDIKDIAAKVSYLVPEAKIVIGHGQMDEKELEAAMVKFVKKEADILVATTIIESGLDIPNANTMFINDSDMYGLADLHQLRGRVGRTKLRAYAYLIVDANKLVTPNAQKRLKAIEEFAELGAGFKIAMRDLEIRGAGNILGAEQSGHIAAIGYEMYCQILENAIRELKKLPPREAIEVHVDLPWPAFLPRDYVPGQKLRIEVYRRLARLRDFSKLKDFREELRERYGPLPDAAEWLLRTTEIRLACVRWQIATIHRDGRDMVFSYKNPKKAELLARLSAGVLKVVDGKSIYWRMQPEDDTPEQMYEILTRLLNPPRPVIDK